MLSKIGLSQRPIEKHNAQRAWSRDAMNRAFVLAAFSVVAFATNVLAGEWVYRVAGVAYNDVLNVRAGASTNYPIVGIIPPDGKHIGMDRCLGSWCEVTYLPANSATGDPIHGWVQSQYLRRDHYCESECTE